MTGPSGEMVPAFYNNKKINVTALVFGFASIYYNCIAC